MEQSLDNIAELYLDSIAYKRWVESNRQVERRDIGRMVRLAVKRELDGEQRKLLKMQLNMGLSVSEIARITGENRSTVQRKLNKIHNLLKTKLEYAVEMQYPGDAKRLLEEGLAPSEAGSPEAEKSFAFISGRLRSLRFLRGYTPDRVSKKTGISKARLKTIEENGNLMSVDELFRLAGFFDVTTDYIVYGTERA